MELRTQRLLLRGWRAADREPFAALNADPEVMEHFPAPLTRAESDALAARAAAGVERRGWGLWAVETEGRFIGFIGLNPAPAGIVVEQPDAVEIGWRLARSAWGRGYATEATRACVAYAAAELGASDLWSFTAVANRRSRAVMERLGMRPVREFDHPALPPSSPVRRHVLYHLAVAGTVGGMSSTASEPVIGTLTVASLIDGSARTDAPGGRLQSTNPANTSEVVADVLLGDAGTFVDAARAARAAQQQWAAIPAPARGRVIAQVGRLVEANKEALAALVTREIGKPYPEALGEVQEIVDTCDFFLGEGRRLYGQTVPSEMPDKQLFTFRVPVGVAAIITAGNFPVAVPSWYLVPAILCGNAVIWKPAEYSAALGDALARIFHAGGVPGGVLNVVHAAGAETFSGLSAALDGGLVDKVGFTGSSAVGSKIGELCGRHLQSPCLELGGKNPMVVMDDADVDLAVDGALFGGFGTAGQRCTSLGTAIVHESVFDEFVAKLVSRLESAPIGDPTSPDVLYGPMIHERFAERFEDWLGLIRDHHTVHGSSARGRITAANPRAGFVGDPDRGLFYHPTLVVGVRADDELYSTETFGPIVGVARFASFDEAMELANGHGYGLSSAIYTRSGSNAFRFRERITAGMVSVNNSTSGAEAHLPFGGNGKSGNGSRQSGIWVLDQFTRWQSMNWDYAGKLQKAQMDLVELPADLGFRL